MDVHLRQLRAFVTVAEERHFTAAATRLHLTQPALTKQIQALEHELHGTLFTRGRAGVWLTRLGEELLPHARAVVGDWDAAADDIARSTRSQARQVLVGLTISVGRGLIARAGVILQRRHPEWSVRVQQLTFTDVFGGVDDGRCDVALLWLPLPAEASIRHAVVRRDPRCLAIPVSHRLAREQEIHMDMVLDEPFLALPEANPAKRAFWLGEDARGGRPARVGAVVNGAEEVLEALCAGTGMAFIAAGNAQLHASADFTVRPVVGIAPAELAIVWRADERRLPVLDLVQACLGPRIERDAAGGPAAESPQPVRADMQAEHRGSGLTGS
jgi:DNA-binding transcriptional LysR family regulator